VQCTRYVRTFSGADSIWHGGARAPTFTNGWARGAPWVEQQARNWPNCTVSAPLWWL